MLAVPNLAFLQLYMAFLQLCRFFGFSKILLIFAVPDTCMAFLQFCRFLLYTGFGFSTTLQILAVHQIWLFYNFVQILAVHWIWLFYNFIDACCTGFGFSTSLHGFSTILQILWLFYNFADFCCTGC